MDINLIFKYLITTIILIAGMIFYFRIADKYNIIDKPNLRSSHDYITIRGGGIVFWLAGVLYFIFQFSIFNFQFLIGITLISTVSIWDDIKSLSNKIRIIIHFISISLIFYGVGLFSILPWYFVIATYILFVGILNAYNFMDGINGITGLCSLAVLIPLLYVNEKVILFTDPNFILFAIMACLVFLFFNFRKQARCFAGDVGSISISFWIVTLLLQLMIKTHSIVWIMFLAVYGADTIFTIIHRLYLKQNIFKAHRMHFYQVMSNEWGISHRKVSALYAFVQLSICGLIIYFREYQTLCAITIAISLSLAYLLKFKKC
jgi:UDP-N-acetylmuramyl pentapeptide phosphotransferase/UDP-N-acetylglucosamine-1-phosphate transferase